MTDFLILLTHLDTSTEALIASIGTYGGVAVFLVVLFFGETAIFISLLLSQQGVLSLSQVFIYATLGGLTADIFWFIVGRYFPKRMVPRFMNNMVLGPVNSFLESVTKDRIFLSILFLKFFIGARLAIILFMSRQKMTFFKFLIYDVVGTILYMIIFTGIGILFGHFIQNAVPSLHVLTSIASGFLLIGVASQIARKMIIKHFAKKQ